MKKNGLGMDCPHCGQRAKQRRTDIKSALTREKVWRCDNDECGHVFVSMEEIVRTITPPMVAKPGINLPMTKRAQWCAEQRAKDAG